MTSAELRVRLDKGWDVVENAKAAEDPRVEYLESFWIDLLHEYENVVDHERFQATEQGRLEILQRRRQY